LAQKLLRGVKVEVADAALVGLAGSQDRVLSQTGGKADGECELEFDFLCHVKDRRKKGAHLLIFRCFINKIDRVLMFLVESRLFENLVGKGTPSMKTFSAKPHEVTREWFVVDAADKVLGRLATEIAHRLRGKHKAIYTPHVDTGDFIVVTNVDKIRVTGNKAEDKKYYRHSGYPGGIYETNFKKMQQRFPGRALEKAVKGMLPKGPLGYAMLKKLKCYAGAQHPHTAQQPKALEI